MQQHGAFDNVNLGLAMSFLGSVMAGFSWTDAAAFLAAMYSLLLIVEKLYRWFWKKKADNDPVG